MVAIPQGVRLGDLPKSEPVPEGTYHLRADKAKYEISKGEKSEGQGMLQVTFTIFGPAEVEEYHGRKIFENFMLEGDAAFRYRQFMEMTGENEEFVLEDTDQVLEREVAAVVTIDKERTDPKTGKVYTARNRIARFIPIA